MAVSTRFIVITLNRGRMTNANAIHGVWLGVESVSCVLSLRLEVVSI